MLDKIVESCQYLLNHFPEAQGCKEYLDSRLNGSSQELFQFGYFPNMENLQALTGMIGEDLLKEEKILYSWNIEDSLGPRAVNYCQFDNHPLIMPFRDPYGKIVSLVGRSILSEKERKEKGIEKYKNTRESKLFKKGHCLFGLYENKEYILKEGCVYIVEGQFDVIKSVEKGFRNIVALGNSSMTSYQFSVISRYTDNIFLLLDNDEAGEKGRKLAISKFGKLANIQNFYLPDPYKDICEYFTVTNDETVSFVVKA
jgi:DNA primase catalytic core